MLNKIKIFFNHERYQSISIAIVLILLLSIYGCPSTVESIRKPGTRINRSELENEVNYLLMMAEAKALQLNQQDELKNTLYQIGLTTAQTGTFNPIGLITTIAGIVGVGATADNIRKRRDIKKWESGKHAPSNA